MCAEIMRDGDHRHQPNRTRRWLAAGSAALPYVTQFNVPVTYYSTLMSIAYGKSGKESGLDGHVTCAKKLEQVAEK